MSKNKVGYCYLAGITLRINIINGRQVIGGEDGRVVYGYLSEKDKYEILKSTFTRLFGFSKSKNEGYFVFIARNDQQADYLDVVNLLKTMFYAVEEVHRSEKFCNPNYFYGNNLQMMIVRITNEAT